MGFFLLYEEEKEATAAMRVDERYGVRERECVTSRSSMPNKRIKKENQHKGAINVNAKHRPLSRTDVR